MSPYFSVSAEGNCVSAEGLSVWCIPTVLCVRERVECCVAQGQVPVSRYELGRRVDLPASNSSDRKGGLVIPAGGLNVPVEPPRSYLLLINCGVTNHLDRP